MLGIVGLLALGSAFMVLARISYRFGLVMHSRPYYYGLVIGGVLMWGGAFSRLIFLTGGLASFGNLYQNSVYTLLSDGLPALGVTLGLLSAWHYWSWLLAERE